MEGTLPLSPPDELDEMDFRLSLPHIPIVEEEEEEKGVIGGSRRLCSARLRPVMLRGAGRLICELSWWWRILLSSEPKLGAEDEI